MYSFPVETVAAIVLWRTYFINKDGHEKLKFRCHKVFLLRAYMCS